MKVFHGSNMIVDKPDDLDEWIDFVCRCRDEYDDYINQEAIDELLIFDSYREV